MGFPPVLIQVSSVSVVKRSIKRKISVYCYVLSSKNTNNTNNKNKLHGRVFLILYYLVSV